MAPITLSAALKKKILSHLKKTRKVDLISCYLYYLQEKFNLHPVLFPRQKKIYQSLEDLISILEKENHLWRETEIQIQYDEQNVNEFTKKIYICPFTGKVFGDNTHPDPQDAIYDWVSKCPENTERVEGLRAKRFYVSEDPEVIKNYIQKEQENVIKTVFSSAITGKLFNSKEAVIEDFKKNHVKFMSLEEVQNQNRFDIEEHFLKFLQDHLKEDKITAFVEALAEDKAFASYLKKWLG